MKTAGVDLKLIWLFVVFEEVCEGVLRAVQVLHVDGKCVKAACPMLAFSSHTLTFLQVSGTLGYSQNNACTTEHTYTDPVVSRAPHQTTPRQHLLETQPTPVTHPGTPPQALSLPRPSALLL